MFLSAGHSQTDPGNIGFNRHEADIAEEFRNILSFCLDDIKVEHEVDGRGLENKPLKDAMAMARKHRVSMEFHCNGNEGKPGTGVEIFCADKDNKLAAKLCVAISESLGIRNRGVKPQGMSQHSSLGFVRAGGMVVELFFLNNHEDLAKYDAFKWKCARAVAKVLSTV